MDDDNNEIEIIDLDDAIRYQCELTVDVDTAVANSLCVGNRYAIGGAVMLLTSIGYTNHYAELTFKSGSYI